MSKNGIESGKCVECGNTVYIEEKQFLKDNKIYIHWSCKTENKVQIEKDRLISKLHNAMDSMTLEQLKEFSMSLPD